MKNNNDGGYKQRYIGHEEYLASLPPGYRFQPTDEQLVTAYLIKKINNEWLPPDLIHVVNRLYEFDPENLAGEKNSQGSSPNRDIVDGFWMAVDYEKPIEHNRKEIAYRIPFVFVRGIMKTDWMMDEFRVEKTPAPVRPAKNSRRLADWK